LIVPLVAGTVLGLGREAVAQGAPVQNRFSTHDWTLPTFVPGSGEPIIGENDFREFWADVKTPGDGSAYSVGTVEVRTTFNAFFSGAQAAPPAQLIGFTVPPGPAAQVVILQQAAVADAPIGWQRFFHGTNQLGLPRGTNGRGVAVFPAAVPGDTRIVICGESRDETLPDSNVGFWPGANATGTAGFLAVFDGSGNLRWSHHLFGAAEDQHCAITDVSVRIEYEQGVPVRDVVTFCGVSTYGMSAANATLTAVRPFAAPTWCSNSAGGATNAGVGQWDGIVGRLVRPHDGSGTTQVRFLSSFGGVGQDGLFGIAEIDAERFAVVGSTGHATAVPSVGPQVPVTQDNCPATSGPVCSGVIAVFSDPMSVGASLQLESSVLLGTQQEGRFTAARDVLFVPKYYHFAGEDAVIVVGATRDDLLLAELPPPFRGPQASHAGGVDGFIVVANPLPPSPPAAGQIDWFQSSFRGTEADEGLTGIHAWNEFRDQFVVTGTSAAGIDVASYYQRPTDRQLTLLTGGSLPGTLGGVQVGGPNTRPTAIAVPANGPAMVNATTLGGFGEFTLGNPAGGAVAVDASGRANVVGTTVSAGFPVLGGRSKVGITHDAVRMALDLVPAGIGRTDGTGAPLPPSGPAGGYPMSNGAGGTWFGGTTPECALRPFGSLIGVTPTAYDPYDPRLQRMLIDWEGPPPADNVDGHVILTRAPESSLVLAAALQFGFPGTNPSQAGPLVLPEGVLLWTTDSSAQPFTFVPPLTEAWRFDLTSLPTGGGTITAQVLFLLAEPVWGGNLGPVCTGSSFFAASPAMWIHW
jgi:hypothetical protein